MSKKKSHLGYTEAEVKKMENMFFVVEFGGDFIIQDNCYLFTKQEASKIYNKTMRNLVNIISDGEEKDRKYAIDLIGKLIVRPMRFH